MIKFLISLAVGTLLALFLLTQKGFENMQLWRYIQNFLYDHTIYVYFINAALFLLPSTILYFMGKKAYLKMMATDEDDIDYALKKKAGYLDSSMSILSVFTAINFMQYGVLYHSTTENPTTTLILFMLGILSTAVLQVSIVKYIQKNDSRLKGDPTNATFNKDFLQSMDEAEQLKVFKSAYKSFQLTKTFTLVLIIISIFMNIFAGTGGFAIIISCIFMIVQIVSSKGQLIFFH
jgi:hypothetical protein